MKLTPKQQKRATKRKNRAEGNGVRRPERKLVQERRARHLALMEEMTSRGPRKTEPTIGEGTQRAWERLRKLFGKDTLVIFDHRMRVKSKPGPAPRRRLP